MLGLLDEESVLKLCRKPHPAAWAAILCGMFVAVAVANGWFS